MAIALKTVQGQMQVIISDVPAFPGEGFGMGFPEAVGDAAACRWPPGMKLEWRPLDGGAWECVGRAEGELSYCLTVTATDDTVDVHQAVTNESPRHWDMSLAFNCFQCGAAPSIRDHECLRHWCGWNGEPRRLIEVPRQFGPRPTIQTYSVEGAPAGRDIPFVANFGSTPEGVTLEGWLAIQSHDGKGLVAVVSKPALFLFQNMEYSCVHSAPGFGALAPGETGTALTRMYFVQSSVADWHARMSRELA
jgi:hypothetical protein